MKISIKRRGVFSPIFWLLIAVTFNLYAQETAYYIEESDGNPKILAIYGDASGILSGRTITYNSSTLFSDKVYIDGSAYSLRAFQSEMGNLGLRVKKLDIPVETEPSPHLFTKAELTEHIKATISVRDLSDTLELWNGTDLLQALTTSGYDFQVGDYFVEGWKSVGGNWELHIDNDYLGPKNPTVAQGVANFFKHFMTSNAVNALPSTPITDPDLLSQITQQQIILMSEYTAFGANVWLFSMQVVVPALDVVIIFSDILDGHKLSALVGFLPYAGRAVKAGNSLLVKTSAFGSTRAEFEKLAIDALEGLRKLPAGATVLDELELVVAAMKHCDNAGDGILGKIFCVAEGTLIHTKSGYVPVEELTIDSLVRSYSEATGELSWQPISQPVLGTANPVVSLTLSNGVDNEEIICTADHPFFVKCESEYPEWRESRNVRIGDECFTRNHGYIEVVGKSFLSYSTKIYSFEVAQDHTFFVGKLGALTHNGECARTRFNRLKATAGSGVSDIEDFLRGNWLVDSATGESTGRQFVRAMLERVDGKVNPNKRWITRRLRQTRPQQWPVPPGAPPTKDGLHEFLPVNRIEQIIQANPDDTVLVDVLSTMREARVSTTSLRFTGIPHPSIGSWYGHVGPKKYKIDTGGGHSVQFHNQLNLAFDNNYLTSSGSAVFDKVQWWDDVKVVIHNYFAPAEAIAIINPIEQAIFP